MVTNSLIATFTVSYHTYIDKSSPSHFITCLKLKVIIVIIVILAYNNGLKYTQSLGTTSTIFSKGQITTNKCRSYNI